MNRNNSRSVIGYLNRKHGGDFEDTINAACAAYRRQGVAIIDKTPEPMRVIQSLGNGKFLAIFTKKAQPDYKGTLKGGRSVVFEAKHTTADRIEDKALLLWQKRALEAHRRLGALTFILVSIGDRGVYSIPLDRWTGIQREKGRKYIRPEDVPEFAVSTYGGQLDFLDIYRHTKQED